MRELPMLLNGHGVRATLAGTKTMTRRPVKPQPPVGTSYVIAGEDDARALCISDTESGEFAQGIKAWRRNPLGVPGDLLYVRETHTWIALAENEYNSGNPRHKRHPHGYPVTMLYRADGIEIPSCWRASIHMPKWAARLWVRNTGVRVERVQEITEEDVLAEGDVRRIEEIDIDRDRYEVYFESDAGRSTCPFEVYAMLWDSIYAKRGLGWDANPFVWVTSYEVTER